MPYVAPQSIKGDYSHSKSSLTVLLTFATKRGCFPCGCPPRSVARVRAEHLGLAQPSVVGPGVPGLSRLPFPWALNERGPATERLFLTRVQPASNICPRGVRFFLLRVWCDLFNSARASSPQWKKDREAGLICSHLDLLCGHPMMWKKSSPFRVPSTWSSKPFSATCPLSGLGRNFSKSLHFHL